VPEAGVARAGRAASLRASAALIAIIVVFLCGHELLYQFGVPRVSRIQRQLSDEYAASIMPPSPPAGGRRVLVLGNSLLLEDLCFDKARCALLPRIDAKRLVIQNTSYYDWYYGIRKLLDAGARPDAIVLVLSCRQLMQSTINDDTFAYRMMRIQDLPSVARDVRLTNTQASNLAFANFSAFWGMRAEVRKWVTSNIFPDFDRVVAMLLPRRSHEPIEGMETSSIAMARLKMLKQLGDRYGTTIVLVIPPTGECAKLPEMTAVENAGLATGVAVLMPVAPESLKPDDYSDGWHLNPKGSDVFTPSFVQSISRAIR
jgi:hypothetical protein